MDKQDRRLSRRGFIQASLAGAGMLATAPLAAQTAAPEEASRTEASSTPLPTRPLGKTGVDVSILNIGGMMAAHSPEYLDQAWALGIRYFDTAAGYIRGQSEQHVAQWIAKYPERRKDLFLVTKFSGARTLQDMLTDIDKRLERCGTDYIDLVFIHGLSPRFNNGTGADVPKSEEFKQVAEQLKKSGKARLVGFSTHDDTKAQQLAAAAEGGFVDAIMVAYNPFLKPTDELNKALDACHEAGIGLISMKEMKPFAKMTKQHPEFEPLGLTTHQAILHAVWSDPRIASICSQMENLAQLTENTQAARGFSAALPPEKLKALREVAVASLPTMCPNCDGRCQEACGTKLALSDIARFVTYYERDGNTEAREFYRALAAEARATGGANLAAARKACLANLDFAELVDKAQRYFA